MTMIDTLRDAQSRSLERIKTAQDQVLAYNERVAGTVINALPEADGRLTRRLPSPLQVVDAYYSVVDEIHQANKEFATQMAAAWGKSSEAAADVEEAPAAKSKAAKATGSKAASAKKSR